MKKLIKPPSLRPGDKVAAISLSWGGAGKFPWRYEAGKRQLEELFGVELVTTKHALKEPEWLSKRPEARAEDMMEAFSDTSMKGIFNNIGGEDGIRVLPHIDLSVIRNNPKIFLGYSDTTNYHLACYKAGLSSFYGPAVLSGFAENNGIFPYLANSVKKCLVSTKPIGELVPNSDGWTDESLDWGEPENQYISRKLNPNTGWKFHQKEGIVSGRLFGGCYEILDWHRGSTFFPTPKELVVARPCNTPIKQHPEYAKSVIQAVREEAGLDIPIVSNMDFGHTDPFLTIPYGLNICIDSEHETIKVTESAVC